jgi:hypothetical protein
VNGDSIRAGLGGGAGVGWAGGGVELEHPMSATTSPMASAMAAPAEDALIAIVRLRLVMTHLHGNPFPNSTVFNVVR